MYLLLFVIGALGFVTMTFLGLAHGAGGHHGGGARGPVGHSHSGINTGQQTHVGHQTGARASTGAKTGSHSSGRSAAEILMWLSPLDIFTLALGAGATGQILSHILPAPTVVWCSVLGALVVDFLLIRPLMSVLLRFASQPSEGLEGEIASVAEATTAFDHSGRGLVMLQIDGQNVQLLGTLEQDERDRGIRVGKGDKVLVVEVDAASNRCRVSREMAPSLAGEPLPSEQQVHTTT